MGHTINNRSVLVVGASGAIGSAVAKRIASPGVTIGLHYHQNRQAIESLGTVCEQQGAYCRIVQSPLSSESTCDEIVNSFCSHHGQLDGLAICSGMVGWTDWAVLTRHSWEEMYWQHCLTPFYLAKSAAGKMRDGGGGSIVYLSSVSAKYGGSPSSLHYAAAKSANETAMHGLARIHAKTGVRVNGVRAGFVDTPQQHSGRAPEQIRERVGMIPMGRAGTPEEVAFAFAYLLSNESGFVTGEILTVAGGD